MTPQNTLIELAKSELGTVENPAGSNNTKYGAAYGLQGQPWCMIFLWWLFRETGLSPLFYGGGKTASCGELLRWAKREGLTVPVEQMEPGDIVILNFSGTTDTQHCGIVVELPIIEPYGFVDIVTVEGNTSPGKEGSQNNGGSVALKVRYPRQIVGVIRPKYQTMDYVGHWGEDAMRWGIGKGLIKGYEDGSFRPDRTVTRAELMTVLMRREGQQ